MEWTELIPAATGLFGVVVGSLATGWVQLKIHRDNLKYSDQEHQAKVLQEVLEGLHAIKEQMLVAGSRLPNVLKQMKADEDGVEPPPTDWITKEVRECQAIALSRSAQLRDPGLRSSAIFACRQIEPDQVQFQLDQIIDSVDRNGLL